MQRSGMRGMVAPIIPGSASSNRATLTDSGAESVVRVAGWIRRAAGSRWRPGTGALRLSTLQCWPSQIGRSPHHILSPRRGLIRKGAPFGTAY